MTAHPDPGRKLLADADARTRQLAANLDRVRTRIARAVADGPASRIPPTLIVVTKFHPAADVQRLVRLGVQDVGENRDQEAAAKAQDVGVPEDHPLRWHFIGQLQSNKAKSVVRYASAVHSVDRPAVATALGTAMRRAVDETGRDDLECFIQVNLGPAADVAAGRGGAAPADVLPLAALLADTPRLRLAGLMAVAPLAADPGQAFETLAGISASLVARFPSATGISAGMSGDLEQAIAAGATHLRVGSDVLGPRPGVG